MKTATLLRLVSMVVSAIGSNSGDLESQASCLGSHLAKYLVDW
jgi:hypothetical protein